MKKITLLLLVLGFSLGSISGQKENSPAKKKKADKIAFISKKLELTPAEAEKFWPVYNQAEAEVKALKKEHRKARPEKKISEMTDDEVEKLIDGGIEFQQKELDLRKKHQAQFKAILPIKKVAKLIHLDHEFKKQQRAKKKGPPGEPHHGQGPPPGPRK